MTTRDDQQLREQIVATCRRMNEMGINQGTSGNISARVDDGILISPSAISYEQMRAEDVVFIDAEGNQEQRSDGKVASTEWRFHLRIIQERKEVGAVVHNHSMYATIVSIMRRSIPAIHYMIAATGAAQVRCAEYATYGTSELSDNALQALEGSDACLLANHGLICVGADLPAALWLAKEVETIAQQHVFTSLLGTAAILPDEEIRQVIAKFGDYGLKS